MFGRIGSGLTPPKYGLRSWWISVDPDPAAGEQPRDPARAGAPHRLDEDVHVGGLAARRGRASGAGTARSPSNGSNRSTRPAASASANGRRSIGDAAVLARCRASMTVEDVRPGRGAGRRLDLEPVVGPRVVAGGDDDAGRRAALDDLVRAHLGRDGVRGERDGDVVREQDLGGGRREVLGREPAVVGDDDALGLLAALDDVARRRRRRSGGRSRR